MADEILCCETCKKTESEAPNLKVCAKCKGTRYCSRECQKAGWKTHKKICVRIAQNAANIPPETINGRPVTHNANYKTPHLKNVEKQIPNPFTRLDNNTYLHDRPEKDVYRLLVDSFRMRQADNRNVEGDVDPNGIYGGAPTSLPGFRRFLKLAAKRRNLLPSWWNDEKEKECEELGSDASTWSNLAHGVEKQDIIQRYGHDLMPMQLRMLAEIVYNRGPGGQDGTGMRQMMMTMETNGGREGGQFMSALSL